MEHIILASTSPRRKEILKKAGIDFTIVSPDYDENILNKTFSYKLIETIAENKAESAAKNIKKPSIIISADTVVIYENLVLGKPKDFADAFKMLSMLNAKTHRVVTAVCMINNEINKKIIKSETSEVTFNVLSEDTIKNYIQKYNPYDKAGAYGIQELPEGFVKEIKGDYDNIVGLPSNIVIKMLNEITKKNL